MFDPGALASGSRVAATRDGVFRLSPLGVLPPVSLVLINWNHERFIGEAIDSIRRQDYPRFECFVIDNASADGSRRIIQDRIRGDPRFTALFLDENLNQMGALLYVLERLGGDLVAVIDSDDFLLPAYVSSHVQVHVSVPDGIALTSSCVLEVDADGRILTGRFDPFGTRRSELKRGVAPASAAPRVPGISDAHHSELMRHVIRVEAQEKGWLWSAGTANMYRREMLELGRPPQTHGVYVAAVDNYYAPFSHALAASALIDKPLSAYRFHAGNRFAYTTSLPGIRTGSPAGVDRATNRRRDILATLCSRPERFFPILGNRFWDVMDLPAHIDGPSREACYESPEVQAMLKLNYEKLCNVLGRSSVNEKLRDRMTASMFASFLSDVEGGRRQARRPLFRRILAPGRLDRAVYSSF